MCGEMDESEASELSSDDHVYTSANAQLVSQSDGSSKSSSIPRTPMGSVGGDIFSDRMNREHTSNTMARSQSHHSGFTSEDTDFNSQIDSQIEPNPQTFNQYCLHRTSISININAFDVISSSSSHDMLDPTSMTSSYVVDG